MEVVPDENDGQVVTVLEGAAVLSDDAGVAERRRFGGGVLRLREPALGPHGVGSWDHVVCLATCVWATVAAVPAVAAAAESRLELGLDGEREDGCGTVSPSTDCLVS